MTAHLSHLAILEHLRPPSGWRTDIAVLSSYSASSSVLAASLLALAGQDDESATGSRIGLVCALTELRGRVHFILQSGRLTLHKNRIPIVALFDQFIIQVPFDEGSTGMHNGKSWHAKFAVVRHVLKANPKAGERWVFLLGSRNLTLDMSWDLGLVLKAGGDTKDIAKTTSQLIPGIGLLASSLAKLFPDKLKDWSKFAPILGKAQWQVPLGMKVSEIKLLLPDDSDRNIPKAPSGITSVVAVSPFLDGKAVTALSCWGCDKTKRELLSIRPEIAKLVGQSSNPLKSYDTLLVLPEAVIETRQENVIACDDEKILQDQMGLHAKFILAKHASGITLWLGSANLTHRAWTRNVECYACVEIDAHHTAASKALIAGLDTFIGNARQLELHELQDLAVEESADTRLSKARVHVATCLTRAVQKRIGGALTIHSANLPHPPDDLIELYCGRLTETPILWPRNNKALKLNHTTDRVADSECLLVSLVLGAKRVEWVQIVEWSPQLEISRDESVLNDYLGPGQMLSWIHTVLNDYTSDDEGGPWDEHTDYINEDEDDTCDKNVIVKKSKVESKILVVPSLEQALRLWLNTPGRLEEIDRILAIWQKRRNKPSEDPKKEKQLLTFYRTWSVLRKGLSNYKLQEK